MLTLNHISKTFAPGTVNEKRALNDLTKSGEVIKIGGGRYTSYTWNREID